MSYVPGLSPSLHLRMSYVPSLLLSMTSIETALKNPLGDPFLASQSVTGVTTGTMTMFMIIVVAVMAFQAYLITKRVDVPVPMKVLTVVYQLLLIVLMYGVLNASANSCFTFVHTNFNTTVPIAIIIFAVIGTLLTMVSGVSIVTE